ncbi:hypothetical protein HDZ31DRAFT_22294, partial [Schizophyllum fasciatum]
EDAEWADFLRQEWDAVAGALPWEGEGAVDRLRLAMEARYALLAAEGGLHGDSILSSVDENGPGCRRRIEVRIYVAGRFNLTNGRDVAFAGQAPEVLTLWKTNGWIVLSHFEMTMESRRIRERVIQPHIRLRNQAIASVGWDARIPVEGGAVDIFG